jgi:Cu+-exporting ATPase
LAKRKCDHCHLEYDESVLIEDNGKYFCCKGCQGIFHLLQSEGLDDFYDKLGQNTIEPPKELQDDIGKFDKEGFINKYVTTTKDGFNSISLIIDGIHCAACVWLNEKVLHKTEGIVEVSINHTNNKAKVVWDDDVIKLSKIIEVIRSIGYNAYPYDASMQEVQANAKRRDYYSRLLVGIFCTMNIMWIAIAQYGGYFSGMRSDIKDILNFAGFILSTPALFYTGGVFFKGAYYGLKNKFVNMDLLVVSGALSAYIFSIYSMFSGHGETYFESVAMIITFVFTGKYLEVLTKKKVVDTLDTFSASIPDEVMVIKDNEKIFVSLENVEVGDIIEIRAGDKVVIDGVITSGEGSFDNSSLSGESEPVFLKKGDKVLSGGILLDSVVRYEAIATYKSSTLSKIVSLLEDSMDKKPKIEKIANQISGYFSTIILIFAVLTFFGWFYYTGSFERALVVAISVIVIACPCALGLATPVATLVGLSRGAKKGVLFKEAALLESIAKCDTVVLDKTGTLTYGKPKVVKEVLNEGFDISLIYSLVSLSTHPISKGVKEYLKLKEPKLYDLEDIKVVEAKGIKATCNGKVIIAGNEAFLKEEGFTCKTKKSDKSLLHVGYDGEFIGTFYLEDLVRDGAKETIAYLKEKNLRVVMLSGDNEKVVEKIANELGIKEYKSSMLPFDKADFIKELRHNGAKVIMVGDGINDTLALSQSEVAIALGSGTDVALSVSDVVLIDESFWGLKNVFDISLKTYKNIKQNLALSVLYNVITIPLAMAGFVIPLIAALSMSLSSLIVVGNSMRIR